MTTKNLATNIAKHPFVAGLSKEHLNALAEYAMRTRFAKGELVLTKGDLANRFYLIQKGLVALESPAPDGEWVTLQQLGPGEVLGWSWLFDPSVGIFARGLCGRQPLFSFTALGYEAIAKKTPPLVTSWSSGWHRWPSAVWKAHSANGSTPCHGSPQELSLTRRVMSAQPNQAANPVSASRLDRAAPWFWFAGAVVASIFLHELGHCSVAWFHGYPAIPTPAKEYIFKPLPEAIQYQVALGGILGSVLALLLAGLCRYLYPTRTVSAIFAGAMLPPGFYTLRFILAGRGHDATEFQEAQAALGLAYAGHSVDWLFLGLFVAAAAFWFLLARPRPTLRLLGRLLAGAFAGLAVLVLLQSINNIIFDRLFESGPSQKTKP